MKKSLLILIMLLSINAIAQHDSILKIPKHEIKINTISLILNGAVDLSYEYLLNENQSIGVQMYYNINQQNLENDSYFNVGKFLRQDRKFSMKWYYRYFFSTQYAKGFYLEGFSMYKIDEKFEGFNSSQKKAEKAYLTGLAFGRKLVSRKNLIVEFNIGVGIEPERLNYVSVNPILINRILVGYRF